MLEKLTVLVIEDSPDLAELFRRTLTNAGFRVSVAASTKFVRLVLEYQKFDVFVSDIGLPDESGLQFMADLRQNHRDYLPRLAIAISAFDDTEQRAVAAGFDLFIAKPFRPAALVSKIEAFCSIC